MHHPDGLFIKGTCFLMSDNSVPVQQQNLPPPAQPSAPVPEEKEAVHFLDYWQIIYSRKEIVIAVTILLILTGICQKSHH